MRSISCPAKINLSLHLLGPRTPDGFTPLHSVVMKVDWCDTLTLAIDPTQPANITLECNWPELTQSPHDNLVVKAMTAFWQARNKPVPGACVITLTKRIPHQAGLGGGSSNAAGMLTLLQYWCSKHQGHGLSEPALLAVAGSLGSDVPLFLHPSTLVTVTGRGEHVTPAPIERVPSDPCLIVKPLGVNVATGWAYDQVHTRAAYSQPSVHWYHNDFETALFPTQPALVACVNQLVKLGARRTLLCGSGSSIAAWFSGECKPTEAVTSDAFPPSAFAWQWVTPWIAPHA